ncbi:MAG: EpsG family protein [Ruthenibacterium sp.]
MIFYSIVTGLSVWLAALAQNKKESASLTGKQSSLDWRLLAVLSAVPLFLTMAFRYDVGTDYLPIYHEIFQQHKMGGHQTVDWDPAYWLIFRVCSALFSSSVSVFIVSSLLIILWYLSGNFPLRRG